MKVIIGLGNPGEGYEGTRHNMGFMMLDALAAKHHAGWQAKAKLKAHVAEVTLAGQKVLFVKPQTYYKLSGEAARAVKDFYKLNNQDILIVHDELALPFGTVRARSGGSDAGNNGIKSITQHIGTDTARIRIGIANEHGAHKAAEVFVLEKLSKDESRQRPDLFMHVEQLVEAFVGENQDFVHTTRTLS